MKDIKISGVGTIAGGDYGDIRITGSGKMDGNINCRNLNVHGKATVLGKLTCENTINASGSIKTTGEVEALKLAVSGSFSAKERVETDSFIVTGSCTIATLSSSNVTITGRCNINEANIDKLKIHARKFNIKTLYANEVIIKIKGIKWNLLNSLNCGVIDHIECTTIQADTLFCKKLYAKDVILGADCQVDYLEYSGNLQKHPKAVVMETVKVDI